jgi:hypothetical protein
MSTSPDDPPRGLVFRSHATSRHRRGVAAVVLLATLALVWPVYPQVSSVEPYVFGLPLSLAWVVGWLIVVFIAVALLYRREEQNNEADTS